MKIKDVYKAFFAGLIGGGLLIALWPHPVSVVPLAAAGSGPEARPVVNIPTQPKPPEDAEEPMTPREEKDAVKASKSITAGNNDGMESTSEAVRLQAKSFFGYRPSGLYQIYCHEGHLTDIQMQPGEDILYIGGGDTTRWVVDRAQSGSGDLKQQHVYLKPMKSGISTNFIIATDRRSYQIRARAGNVYNPIVGWTYPLDDKAAFVRTQAEKKQKEEDQVTGPMAPEKMNFGYKIEEKTGWFGSSYSWTPKMVFDDGAKTYIQMASTMPSGEAPALFVSDQGSDLMIVNYRVKKNYYIVDRLFDQAEMRNGMKERVIITRTH